MHTRPTADRVKEALFSMLGPPRPAPGDRFRVLDLFAGTGALGLEAISRGADEAVLVEQDATAVRAVQRNVSSLGAESRVRVLRLEAGRALRTLIDRFDWIFLDPPYQGGALDRALRLLGDGRRLAQSGLVIAEHDAKSPPVDGTGRLALHDRRSWGQTAISLYRLATLENP